MLFIVGGFLLCCAGLLRMSVCEPYESGMKVLMTGLTGWSGVFMIVMGSALYLN